MACRRIVATLAVALAAAPAAAEAPIFHDGFELGELCSWSSAPAAAVVAETASANDTAANAQTIARCAVVDGAIAAIEDGLADFDFYAVQTLPLGLTPLAADGTTTREIVLPAAGTWYVLVGDQRNWDRSSLTEIEPPVAGGAGTTYRLTLEVEPLEGQFAFPTTGEPLEIAADGALVLYELYAGQTVELGPVEVFAERLGSPSPLDARLYVIADPHGTAAVIAACDDQTTGGDCATGDFATVDPALAAVALGATTPHLVVVDFYDVYDPVTLDPQSLPAPFELDLQFLPPGP